MNRKRDQLGQGTSYFTRGHGSQISALSGWLKRLCALTVAIVAAGATSHADSLALDGVVLETVGSTAVITGSGDASNTTTWSSGVTGQFIMKAGNGDLFGMTVSTTNPTGSLSAGTDSLMVARTVDSQGLTDNGTLSVYVRPTGSSDWSLDLNFSFYNVVENVSAPGGYDFTTPYSFTLLLTSLDIDFDQQYFTSTTDFTSNNTYAPSQITSIVSPPIGYNGFTSDGDADFSDPAFAVSSGGTGSSFDVRVAHDNVALFMFEFRDPSSIVPEPGTFGLVTLGLVFLTLHRRRNLSA